MGQVSPFLRRAVGGHAHWCPGCGDLVDSCCHYILTAGRLNFCGDSTHKLSGQTVDLPPLPDFMTDAYVAPSTPGDPS